MSIYRATPCRHKCKWKWAAGNQCSHDCCKVPNSPSAIDLRAEEAKAALIAAAAQASSAAAILASGSQTGPVSPPQTSPAANPSTPNPRGVSFAPLPGSATSPVPSPTTSHHGLMPSPSSFSKPDHPTGPQGTPWALLSLERRNSPEYKAHMLALSKSFRQPQGGLRGANRA